MQCLALGSAELGLGSDRFCEERSSAMKLVDEGMGLLSMGGSIKSCDKLHKVKTQKEEQWRKRFEEDSGMHVEDIAGIVIGARPQPGVPSPRIRQR